MSTKQVAYLLDNRDDPEVDAAIKAYLKAQYGGAKASPASAAGELVSKIEKKYIAAQVVAQGVQVRYGNRGKGLKSLGSCVLFRYGHEGCMDAHRCHVPCAEYCAAFGLLQHGHVASQAIRHSADQARY